MTSYQNPNTPDKLDILIDQVGHFTEGLTELRILVQSQAETAQKQLEAIDKQGERLDKQLEAIDKQSAAIDKQSAAIDKQSAAIDKQSAAIDKQSAAIDKQEGRMDKLEERLEQMGERLDQLIKNSVEQCHSIDRIADAMEASNRTQAEAINRLVAVVDRLLPTQP